ncbi:Sec-independent protein translocase subunit TatA [Arthrobacter sp. MMS24-T111]
MGRLLDGPWPMMIIIVVALLLFATPKLPAMARSLGQSMRIIKSEVKEMKNDEKVVDADAAGPLFDGHGQYSPAKSVAPPTGTP